MKRTAKRAYQIGTELGRKVRKFQENFRQTTQALTRNGNPLDNRVHYLVTGQQARRTVVLEAPAKVVKKPRR